MNPDQPPAYDPLESLLRKLAEWLKQQPEYPLVLTSGTRDQRRKAAQQVAKMVFTIPHHRRP